MKTSEWAAIVQAMSAVASAVLAYWIARLTARYASSTDKILKANEETLRVLREELNETREERRAPIRNVLERLELAMNSCLEQGLQAMSADALREVAPTFDIRDNALIKEVRFRDHQLARILNSVYDLGSEAERHLRLMSTAKSADRPEMYGDEQSRLRNTFSALALQIAAARERLRRY